MFDTYIQRRVTDRDIFPGLYREREKNVNVTVKEQRAPTDESVRLLTELEDKARDKLVSITKLEGNTLHATWHVFWNAANPFEHEVKCRFKLNDKQYEIAFDVDKHTSKEELAKKCLEKINERLSRIFAIELFTTQRFDV